MGCGIYSRSHLESVEWGGGGGKQERKKSNRKL